MMAMPMPNLNMPTPPATKGKRPLRHLTATDKIEAIQRIHDGESKASVARDIGVPESTLRGWCKNEEKLRYMSRQSQENAEKLNSDAMASAMGVDFMNGPPEKRMKFDSSFFANGKLKYDELQRRAAAGMGLDLSDKRGDMGLTGLGMGDYNPLSGLSSKTGKDIGLKGFGGADMGKTGDTKGDLSMAAISPLTSLSHLSGMSGLGQSPLALSFNDIANNLNLLAQLNNPSLAAMSGLSGVNASGSNKSSSNRSMKPNPHSPGRPEGGDKSPSLTVKNLAKLQQKSSTELSGMTNFMDKYKKQQQAAQGAGRDAPVDDALWYWLKSQQTMLGLNNLYSQLPRPSSPQDNSPSPQFQNNPSTPITRIPTPPIINTPRQTPPTSSTPEVDSKQTSWFWQWYKNFGASFTPTDTKPGTPNANNAAQKAYENILYSQLTKNDNINNNYESHSSTPKPEDLSQHPDTNSPHEETPESEPASPVNSEGGNDSSDKVKVKEELDNVLYNNNNNNDEKSDNGEGAASDQDESVKSSSEALEHGEKFLRWLETCSDPSVTAMQVMQFRLLINCLKNSAERMSSSSITANNGSAEEKPPKIRRRK
ncbi:protein distal antenna-like [Culicoides brevitarsis]|uniref:protein distal antenna-like n=1 Tax=Culicoides brevitarsis TaxID=469753 RepID=UPI00307C79A0